jgi:hypothetical protein
VDVNERRWRSPYRRRDLDNPPAIDFIGTGIIITTIVVVRDTSTTAHRIQISLTFVS